jgi:Fe-S-cluster containining protein
MRAPRVADTGTDSAPTRDLLTAIDVLRADLEAASAGRDSESGEYYERVTGVLRHRLPDLYAAYEACVEQVLITEGRRIRCARSCSACCRHFVASVEPFELLALDAHLKSRPDYAESVVSNYRKSSLYDELLRRERESGLPDEEADDRATYRYFLKGAPCTFLEPDGSCGVYAHRPMACRMFFAESSPRFCAGKAIASPWNRNFQVEMSQEVEEALARCSRVLENLALPDGLFPGLVAVNERFGRYEPAESPESPVGPESSAASSVASEVPPA